MHDFTLELLGLFIQTNAHVNLVPLGHLDCLNCLNVLLEGGGVFLDLFEV